MLEAIVDSFYGKSHILHGVELRVDTSEGVALLGRNGAGKTTFLRSIMGMVDCVGSIKFDGQELTATPTFLRAQGGLGYVPEHRGIFGKLSVSQNLDVCRNASGSWKMDDVYNLFPRLYERRNSLGKVLSGGEQQMLAIGRALLTNPRLLLLDEPSQGLAPIVVTSIFSALRDLMSEGLGVLIVEQNVSQALQLVQRAYILDSGRIVHCSGSNDLLSDSATLRRYIGLEVA